jgi:hypothetical protein
MGDPSTAVLLEKFQKDIKVLSERIEKFQKHIKDLSERIEKLKILSATRGKTRPLTRAKPAGLLSLPLEIRLHIYHYCVPRKRVVEVSDPNFHMMAAAGRGGQYSGYISRSVGYQQE